jgi:hypothetical protein
MFAWLMRCKSAPKTNGMTTKLDAGEFVFICNASHSAARPELNEAIANLVELHRGSNSVLRCCLSESSSICVHLRNLRIKLYPQITQISQMEHRERKA